MMSPPPRKTAEVLNSGTVLIEVDDILEGGDEEHRGRMKGFYQKYQCGKQKRLMDLGKEGALISGIRVIQHSGFSIGI